MTHGCSACVTRNSEARPGRTMHGLRDGTWCFTPWLLLHPLLQFFHPSRLRGVLRTLSVVQPAAAQDGAEERGPRHHIMMRMRVLLRAA